MTPFISDKTEQNIYNFAECVNQILSEFYHDNFYSLYNTQLVALHEWLILFKYILNTVNSS